MKVAQSKYSQIGIEVALTIYFDRKAFDLFSPPLSEDAENELIREICDSIAAALPQQSAEKTFYIKKLILEKQAHRLKLLCTDGFLIDDALILPITPQAFSKERVRISEIDQLPTRLKFSNDLLKMINEKMPTFEEEARKLLGSEKITIEKKYYKQERGLVAPSEFAVDKIHGFLAEITQTKKEVKDITESTNAALASLVQQIENARKKLYEQIVAETKKNLEFQDNKSKIDDYAHGVMSQIESLDTEKCKEPVVKKMNEVAPLYEKFSNDIEQIAQRVSQQVHILMLFKQQVIHSLYDSAMGYRDIVAKKMDGATTNTKKTLMIDFNKKFDWIAAINETGELTSFKEAEHNLVNVSIVSLQKIISNAEKASPGLLQKCNTSWTEESPELKIVLKNLSKLNKTLPILFNDQADFAEYANKEMIEITRIPFPRSFQFKFSENTEKYIKSMEKYCSTQREQLVELEKNYKKSLHTDDLVSKTRFALSEILKQGDAMKKPVEEFSGLLKRKEHSGSIIASANVEHEKIVKCVKTAGELKKFIASYNDPSLRELSKKVNIISQEAQAKSAEVNQIMKNLIENKSQIDLTINQFINHPNEMLDHGVLDEKIKLMEDERNELFHEDKAFQALTAIFATYENILNVIHLTDSFMMQNPIASQRNQAKHILLQFLNGQSRKPGVENKIDKKIMGIYADIDLRMANSAKMIQELNFFKKELFSELNYNAGVPTSEMQARLNNVREKLREIEPIKAAINKSLSRLKKLTHSQD